MKLPAIKNGTQLALPRVLIAAVMVGASLSVLQGQTTGDNNVEPLKDIYELKEIEVSQGAKYLPFNLETSIPYKRTVNGAPVSPPQESGIKWSADKGAPTFAPEYGASVKLDFEKPFVKEDSADAKKVTVTAQYTGSATVEYNPQKTDVDRIYLDFWIAETEESTDDVLIVRHENAQPAADENKVIHWSKVIVKHDAPGKLPLELKSSGDKTLYFYGEEDDPNELEKDPELKSELSKELETEKWFWIGTDEKGTGEGKFKAKGDLGTGLKDAPEEKTVKFLPVEVEEVIEPSESAECTGYDKDTNALMVPMAGSNKIKVKIAGATPGILQKMKFVAEPAGKLTIAPEVPTAAVQELTFSGTADALGVKVQIEFEGSKVNIFEADVLKMKAVTLNVRTIVDSDTNVAVVSPTKNQIESYMKLFKHQVNIDLSAVVTNVVADYDQTDNKKFNYEPFGPANFTELPLLYAAAPKSEGIDYYMFKAIEPDHAGVYLATEDIILGRDTTNKCTILYIMAHETGHALGRRGHSSDNDSLMADGLTSTCGRKVGRNDWRMMNK